MEMRLFPLVLLLEKSVYNLFKVHGTYRSL